MSASKAEFGKREAAGWERWEAVLMHALGSVNPVLFRALELTPGQRVVDFGCGTGDPALAIAQWVGPRGNVLGVDLSQAMLDVAKRRASCQNLTQVRFRRADMVRFRHHGPRFDRAVSRYGLMFASDIMTALASIRGCLRPGGRLVASVWGPIEKSPGQTLRAEAVLPFLKEPPPDHETTPNPMRFEKARVLPRLLRDAGFRNVMAESVGVCAVYPNLETYVQVQRDTALAEIFRTLKPDERRRLVRRLRGRFRCFALGGVVRVPAQAWVVSGER